MTKSFGDMKASLQSLVVEESPAIEDAELQMAQPDEQAAWAVYQQRPVATESAERFKKVRNLTQLNRAYW